jgi:hypothetical protein
LFPKGSEGVESNMSKKKSIWTKAPNQEDYEAARRFLCLLFSEKDVTHLVTLLRRAHTEFFEAKDILRAAQCDLLAKDSPHVAADLKKIDKDKKLSPVLLVRGQARAGVPLIIADGHHRICASWYWEEQEPVACCIAAVQY